MKRFFKGVFLVGGVFFGLYLVLISLFKVPRLQQFIQANIEEKLTEVLARDVVIEELSGTIFAGIKAKNVTVSTQDKGLGLHFFKISELKIFFSPTLKLTHLPSYINRVSIDGFDINVIRSKNKKLNVQQFVKLFSSPGGPAFRFDINIDNVTGKYIDYRGWGKAAKTFSTNFTKGQATIVVDSMQGTVLNVDALPDGGNEHVRLNALFNKGSFYYEFEANSLITNYWSDYFVPFPKLKVMDDLIHVKGRLDSREKKPGELPFFFKIDIDFDYLKLIVPTTSKPITNIGGSIVFSNFDDTTLVFENTFGQFDSIPIEIIGYINLKRKKVDLNLVNLSPIIASDLIQNKALKASNLMSFNTNVNYHVFGNTAKPKTEFKFKIYDFKLNQYQLDPLLFSVKKHKNGLMLRSLDGTGVKLNGQIKKGNYQFNISDFPLQTISNQLDSTASFNVYLKKDDTTLYVSMDDMNAPSLFGFDLDSITTVFNFEKSSIVAPTFNIGLRNSQELVFNVEYDTENSNLKFNTIGLNLGGATHLDQYIYDADIRGNLNKKQNTWTASVDAKLNGVGASFRSILVEEFRLNYSYNKQSHNIYFDALKLPNGEIQGGVKLIDSKPKKLDLVFKDVSLDYFNLFYKPLFDYDLQGSLNGNVVFSDFKTPTLKVSASIDQFQTIYGLFGQVALDASFKNNRINLNQLLLSQIHRLNLKGFVDLNKNTLNLNAKGDVQLNAFQFFSAIGLIGKFNINGNFKGDISNISFDGLFKSRDLKYKGFVIEDIYFDGLLNSDQLLLRNSKITFDSGHLALVGDLNFVFDDTLNNFLLTNYQISADFNNVNLNYLSDFYMSLSSSLKPSSTFLSNHLFSYIGLFEFHKYEPDNLDLYLSLDNYIKKNNTTSVDIQGVLNGQLNVSNQKVHNNSFDLKIRNFRYLDFVQSDHVIFKSEKISLESEHYRFYMSNLRYKNKLIQSISADVFFRSRLKQIAILNTEILFRDTLYSSPFIFQYDINNQWLLFNAKLTNNAIDLVSIPFSLVDTISNKGVFNFTLDGPLNDLRVSSLNVLLSDFELSFDSQNSVMDSKITIDSYSNVSNNGQFIFNNTGINWQGADTFRRVTRDEKLNVFKLNGMFSFNSFDLIGKKVIEVDFDLNTPYSFFSINFPKLFVGDIIATDVSLTGNQFYPIGENGRNDVYATLGTEDENGPTVSGSLVFRDGIFNLPKAGKKYQKPRLLLDMDVVIGPANYIRGSLVGDGVYNLASNVSLEIDEKISEEKINLSGSINAPQLTTKIPFYEGSVAILDEVYELLPRDQQVHYFKDTPEYISDQYVLIESINMGNKRGLKTNIHLRALRKNDLALSTENIRNDQLLYDAVGLAFDGDFKNRIPQITVFDFSIDNPYSIFPTYEFFGSYDILLESQTNLSESTYYGLGLLMPEVISDSDDLALTNYGRQRINSYIKSSIRPYERRLAKRIGLYDLRVTYDFGKTILNYDSDSFKQEDLLGIQFVSDLYKEKMFLSVKTDVNLSSDYSTDTANGFKVTQVDFTYYFQPGFSLGLKNVNEYSEVTELDPRWWLNYGYSF